MEPVNPSVIKDKVCGVTGVPGSVLCSRSCTAPIVQARRVLLYCLRELYPWMSLTELSKQVGKGCHVTASHGLRKADWLYANDESFKRLVDAVLGDD